MHKMTTTWMLISGNCFLHILISKYIFIYSHGTTPFTLHQRAQLVGRTALALESTNTASFPISFRNTRICATSSRRRQYRYSAQCIVLLAVDVVITVNRKRWSFSVLLSLLQHNSRRWGVYKHIQIYSIQAGEPNGSAFSISRCNSINCTYVYTRQETVSDSHAVLSLMLLVMPHIRCFMWLGGAIAPLGFDSSRVSYAKYSKLGPRIRANSYRHTQHTLIRDFRCAIYRHICEFLTLTSWSRECRNVARIIIVCEWMHWLKFVISVEFYRNGFKWGSCLYYLPPELILWTHFETWL